jgi:MFS family permease
MDARLRTIAVASAALVFVGAFTYTNWVLYIVSLVGDGAALVLGVLFTAGSVGFLVGAAVAPAVGRRIGIGGAIMSGALLVTVSPFFMPIAPAGDPPLATALLGAAAVVGAFGSVVGNVHTASIVQAVTPDALLGRVSSATGTLRNIAFIAGTVIGGLIGTYIGLREAILLSALGHLVPLAIVAASPLRHLTALPEPPAPTAT